MTNSALLRTVSLAVGFALAACQLESATPTGGDTTEPSTEKPAASAASPPEAADASAEAAGGGEPALPREACTGDTKTLEALAYASTHAKNLLDLYVPANGQRCPLVVWIHGGGWQGGSREMEVGARTHVLRLVARGYAVASIDYRLSSDAIFPAQIHDVKAAIRYLRANAASLRIDAARVALWGTSAGGHLAALAGTSGEVPTLEDLGQGNASVPSRVQAVIDCYGPTVLPAMDAELASNGCPGNHSEPGSPESKLLGCASGLATCAAAPAASPLTYVDPNDPPMLLGHGLADCTVPYQQTDRLASALAAAGVRVSAHPVAGGTHRIESCPSDAVVDTFLDDVLR